MRRLIEGCLEGAREMKSGQSAEIGQFIQTEVASQVLGYVDQIGFP